MKQIREKLTYANVMSTIAVLLVIGGGTAYAAGLGKNSVHSRNIAPGAVKTKDIAKSAVNADRLKANAVTGPKLADGSVDARQLAAGAVQSGKLAPDLEGKLNALQTGGIVRVDASGSLQVNSPEVPLMSRGPFRLYGKCWVDSGTTVAQTYVASTAAGTLATGTTVAFRGGAGSPYMDPSSTESNRRISSASVLAANAAGFGGAAVMINGSSSISFAVNGWIKGSAVAADSGNYGSGGARCLFSPSLVAYSG